MEELFLILLNRSLTACYVILIVILVRLLLKKAPKIISYALWGVVALRLLIPFSFESGFSLLAVNAAPIPQDIAYYQKPQITSGLDAVDNYVNSFLPSAPPQAEANPLKSSIRAGAAVWLSGCAAMLFYSVYSLIRLRRHLKKASKKEHNIYEAEQLKTPFVLGIFKPRIYLPKGLEADERLYILRHEQIHIRRGDPLIKAFSFLVLTLYWFNPLVWLSFHLMNTDMELSCDEKVIKEIGGEIKKAYSASLLSFAADRPILNGGPLAFGEGNVKGRIKNVLNYRKPGFWLVTGAVAAAVIVGVGLSANPKNNGPGEDIPGALNNIQVELATIGTNSLSGRVITDKDGFGAGEAVVVVLGKSVTYEVESLAPGDWIDISYTSIREKLPPEFVADDLKKISADNLPAYFTFFEEGKATDTKSFNNPAVALEMPALLLNGLPGGDQRQSTSDTPEASRYLMIDIGELQNKIYYTFEKDGKYYVQNPSGAIWEIAAETFNTLYAYPDKNEITH